MGITNGRIKQSVAFWCFNSAGEHWDLDKTCQVVKGLGCGAIEVLDPSEWAPVLKHGMVCAMTVNGMPGEPFVKGFNNPLYHDELITRTKKAIDATAAAGFPNVIAFVGYRWRDAEDPTSGEIPNEEAVHNCVQGFKQLMPYAEQKGVNLCLEHLNTRVTTHPMQGHPGYQGDDLDLVASIIRQVDSPRLRLLFDIYHVQVMHGDILCRLEENKDLLGHVHVAGVPGRGELDARQEVNFPAVMHKLLEIGYDGYVGQEFIPTRDPLSGLEAAIELCDV